MDKLSFLSIIVTIFLIFFIEGCQLTQKYDSEPLIITDIPPELSKEIIKKIYHKRKSLNLCEGDIDQSISSDSSSVYKLKDNQYLIEILCFLGAYQGNYQYFIYTINDSQKEIKPLSFQTFTRTKNNDLKIQNNFNLGGIPDYNEEDKLLTIYTKGRGLADCGTFAKYKWKDSQFNLLEYREKKDCDGNYLQPENYPQIYP